MLPGDRQKGAHRIRGVRMVDTLATGFSRESHVCSAAVAVATKQECSWLAAEAAQGSRRETSSQPSTQTHGLMSPARLHAADRGAVQRIVRGAVPRHPR